MSAKKRVARQIKKEFFFTEKQQSFKETIKDNIITFATGVAGTAKTFTAMHTALELLFTDFRKLIITKPLQESGEKIGFLPGEIEDKIKPYAVSYMNTLEKILSFEDAVRMEQERIIRFEPLAYLRGVTFENSIMILDEAQNATIEQLILFITRLGTDSKMIIIGDTTQTDIGKSRSGLHQIIKVTENVPGVGFFAFSEEDIIRHPILTQILKNYQAYRDNKK